MKDLKKASELTLEIAQALREVSLMKEGKLSPLTLKDIFDDEEETSEVLKTSEV